MCNNFRRKILVFTLFLSILLPVSLGKAACLSSQTLTHKSRQFESEISQSKEPEPNAFDIISEVGQFDDSYGEGHDVSVAGDLAFVSFEAEGLNIYNISDKTNPVFVFNLYNSGNNIRDILFVNGLLYLADYTGKLIVVNISDPTTITEVNQYPITYCTALEKQNDLLFAGTLNTGVSILNISDPTNIAEIANYNNNSQINGIAVDGNYLYLSVRENGLEIVNITDPATPSFVSSFDNDPNYAMGIAVSGNFAYIPKQIGGIEVLNITNKLSPVEISQGTVSYADDIKIEGSELFVCNSNNLRAINISDPTNLIIKHTQTSSEIDTYFRESFFLDNVIYAINHHDGLYVVTYDSNTGFTEQSIIKEEGPARQIALHDDLAFIAQFDGGLEVINISDQSNPVKISTYFEFSLNLEGVTVSTDGNYLFLAAEVDGLIILNATDPLNLTKIGTLAPSYAILDILLDGDIAFVADASSGLGIVNITDLQNPSFISHFDTDGYASKLAKRDNYIFVADGSNGIQIIDVTNLSIPTDAGYFNNGGYSESVTVRTDEMFVGNDEDGLQIVDISTISAPALVESFSISYLKDISDIDIYENDYAILSYSDVGISLVDISNSSDPTLLGSFKDGGIAKDAEIYSGTIFVADGLDNLEILSLDVDQDGLTDQYEQSVSMTDPFNEDTDLDGLQDGDEVSNHFTDPLNEDTDGDGLSDGDEVNFIGTNPLDIDTDSDTLPDDWEHENGTDPLTSDATNDPDNDNLTNLEEYNEGTDPQNSDTDTDGLPDGWEISFSLNPLDASDAALDGDSDGLENLDEYREGTNPNLADTDGDGFSDGEEVTEGTDPLDSEDYPTSETPSSSSSTANSGINLLGVVMIISCSAATFAFIKKRK